MTDAPKVAKQKVVEFVRLAKDSLKYFPDSNAKKRLFELANTLVNRKS
jgi:geranylgeranyl pyrophosphate synthase